MDWVSFFLGCFVTLNVQCIFWCIGEFLDAGPVGAQHEDVEPIYVISSRP